MRERVIDCEVCPRVCCFFLPSPFPPLLPSGQSLRGQGHGGPVCVGALSLSPSKGGDVQGKPLCHSPRMELTYEIFRFFQDIISGCQDPAAAYTPRVLWASFFSSPDPIVFI